MVRRVFSKPSRSIFALVWSFATCIGLATNGGETQNMSIEDFSGEPAETWRFVSDRVMGGVSNGEFQILKDDTTDFARLTGTVSTENNGGFIQFRRDLEAPFDATSTGLTLSVRGNGASYFVHLRTKSSMRPWQYFAAPFETNAKWSEVVLPWSAFGARGGLQGDLVPSEITSIGIVAYGADFEALVDVDWIAINQTQAQ